MLFHFIVYLLHFSATVLNALQVTKIQIQLTSVIRAPYSDLLDFLTLLVYLLAT